MSHLNINNTVVVDGNTFEEMKTYCDSTNKALVMQYIVNNGYDIFAVDNNICYRCHIFPEDTEMPGLVKETNNAELLDFETNWKTKCNKENVQIVNQKQYFVVPPGRAITNEEGFYLDCKNGDAYTICTIHFPYNVDVLGGRTYNDNIQLGDYVNFWAILHDDPSWGTVTVEASSGQALVTVSSTVLSEIYPGVYVKLGSEFGKYRVDSVDYENGVLTLNKNLTETKAVDSAVRLYWPSAYNKYVPNSQKCDIGLVVAEASGFTPEWDMVVEYHHVATLSADKKIYFNIIYRY